MPPHQNKQAADMEAPPGSFSTSKRGILDLPAQGLWSCTERKELDFFNSF